MDVESSNIENIRLRKPILDSATPRPIQLFLRPLFSVLDSSTSAICILFWKDNSVWIVIKYCTSFYGVIFDCSSKRWEHPSYKPLFFVSIVVNTKCLGLKYREQLTSLINNLSVHTHFNSILNFHIKNHFKSRKRARLWDMTPFAHPSSLNPTEGATLPELSVAALRAWNHAHVK